jgi:hypothetical protein
MHRFIRIILCLVFIGIPTFANAVGLLVLDERLQRQYLAPYALALEDPDASMSIEEVRRHFSARGLQADQR